MKVHVAEDFYQGRAVDEVAPARPTWRVNLAWLVQGRGLLLLQLSSAISEAACNVDVVIFDKTGTLTTGELCVVGVVVADGRGEQEALALATAVEGDSEHLLACAIREAANDRGLVLPPVAHFEVLRGRGVRASHDGRSVPAERSHPDH